MNYISLIGVGIFILAWITYVAVWVTEVYRLFRTEPRMRPVILLSNFSQKLGFFKITLAFMAVAAFGWLVGVVGAKVQ
jgi:hypothetical protein